MSLTGGGGETQELTASLDASDKDHELVTCRDLAALKNEILLEMRRELQKTKAELIEGTYYWFSILQHIWTFLFQTRFWDIEFFMKLERAKFSSF